MRIFQFNRDNKLRLVLIIVTLNLPQVRYSAMNLELNMNFSAELQWQIRGVFTVTVSTIFLSVTFIGQIKVLDAINY